MNGPTEAFSLAVEILKSSLQLGERAARLTPETELMGAFPEFNSLTVVGIVAGIEESTGSEVDDNEISEEIFQTVGSLAEFIARKL